MPLPTHRGDTARSQICDCVQQPRRAYRDKGDTDRAIADYTEAIRLDPKFAIAYNNRGLAYRDKGDTDRAIADFTEAIRLDPKFANAYASRGVAYRDKGDMDRAIADYTEAIRLDPKLAIAYVNRGLAYEKLADFARARSDFNATLGLSQKGTKWPQDKARERLAALPSPPPATATSEKSNRCVVQPLLRPLHRCWTIASPLSSAILLMKTWPPYRTQSATQI